jgi:hypothetical protein
MFPQPNIFTLQPVLVPGMIARPMRTPFCGHPRHTHTHTHTPASGVRFIGRAAREQPVSCADSHTYCYSLSESRPDYAR